MDRSISDENPVVITCALTGSIHGKKANLNLPEQPEEIAEQGVAAGGRGRPSSTCTCASPTAPTSWIPESTPSCETDAIAQLTTGGRPVLSVEKQIDVVYLSSKICTR